jgi:aminopeptidase N
MLRGLVGDEAFWTGIRDYYGRYRNGNATTADFRRAMEQASGSELGWFFEQWLTRGGMPNLRGRWSYEPAAGVVRLDLEQLQPGPAFRLPLDVAIRVAGEREPRLERIELTQARQGFSMAVEGTPESLVLDPRDFVLMDAELARLDDAPR